MFDHRLMEMCPESRQYIIRNVILQWCELMMNALMIAVIAVICERLYQNTLAIDFLIKSFLIVIVTMAVRFYARRSSVRMSWLASRTIKRIMREKIYEKLLKLGSGYRAHVEEAELVQESVEGTDQLESYFGQYVPQFFYAFLAPLTLFLLFGIAGSWKAAAVLLVCVPLIPGAIMMVQKIAKKLLAGYWDQYAKLGSTFLENLQGMTALKIYQADAFKNEQMNEESENFRRITMKVLTMQLNSIIIMDFFAYGGAALGIIMALRAFCAHTIGIAGCLFMILLSADFFLPMRQLGSYFHVAMNGMAASDRIFRFLNEEEPPVKTEIIPSDAGDIGLQGVSFSYNDDQEVLHDISMTFPKGSFTGIVGESGSGKSTIAGLLMGRNVLQTGDLTIGGKKISEIREDSLFDHLTYIGSDSVFFKGTLRENLIVARNGASDDKIMNVLDQCGIGEYFRQNGGLDAQLKENAENLSGGQRQRLALARAILHDSPVWIFDEATSNIDIESEETILDQISKMRSRKTIIMITHRLANVTGADRIYCMEHGTIAGEGTHKELLEHCAVYRNLWNTQQELENFGKENGHEAE
ncbi:MAG: ABC transporter ATP-binding protein/permease [Solobacterium sp.]|nr:ABC transporter ATP-binding protein/permease [Solobacterium sp.]